MLQTPLCRAFGIEFPILSVGMSWLAGPELAAAVSNAGGCGVVGVAGMVRDQVRARIRETRALTNKPFGANIIIARMQEGQVEACLDEGAPLTVFFWGDPSRISGTLTARVAKCFCKLARSTRRRWRRPRGWMG